MHDTVTLGGAHLNTAELARICGLIHTGHKDNDEALVNGAVHALARFLGTGAGTSGPSVYVDGLMTEGNYTISEDRREVPEPYALGVAVSPALRLDAAGRAAYHAETGDCPEHPATDVGDIVGFGIAHHHDNKQRGRYVHAHPDGTPADGPLYVSEDDLDDGVRG